MAFKLGMTVELSIGMLMVVSMTLMQNRMRSEEHKSSSVELSRQRNNFVVYLLKAYRQVNNRTGLPQGFSLIQVLQKLNTIQNMHILQT